MSPPLPLFYIYLFPTRVSKIHVRNVRKDRIEKWCLYKSSEKLSEMSGKEDNPVLCPDKDLKIYVRNVRGISCYAEKESDYKRKSYTVAD